MDERQKIFIESMVRMGRECPEYVEQLKAITKSYIITEGITDYLNKAKSYAGKAKKFLTTDPSKVDIPESGDSISYQDKVLLKVDKDTFQREYGVFRKNVEKLINYMRQFGTALVKKCVNAKYFQDAENEGAHLDEIKRKASMKDPVGEAIEKSMQFVAVLESISAMGYPALAKNVYEAYMVTEDMGISVCDLFESSFSKDARMVKPSEYNPADVKAASEEISTKVMPGIASFIKRHGKSAWDQVKKSTNFQFALKWANIMNGVTHG